MVGRPREFDTESALEAAIDVFWECGYEATSLTELVAAMRIGRQSIYTAFGSKYGLFLTALEHYTDCELELLRPVGRRDAGLQEIIDYFHDRVRSLTADDPRPGCMLINSITELAALDEEVTEQGNRYLRRMTRAFSGALRNAIAAGDIEPTCTPREMAHHLANTAVGLAVQAKGGVSRKNLRGAVRAALAALSSA